MKDMINKVSSECRTYTQQEVDNIVENYRYENAHLKAEVYDLKNDLAKQTYLADKFREIKHILSEEE